MRGRLRRLLPDRADLRRRAGGLLLALAAEALLVVMLLTLAPPAGRGPDGGSPLITVALPPSLHAAPARTPAAKAESDAAPERPPPPPPPSAAPPTPWELPPGIIPLTREQFAQADIGKLPQRTPAAPASEAGPTGGAPDDSAAVGTAPNGEPLYAAEWVREPTDAELAFYLPKRSFGAGWGVIACRTVARFKVEDCVPLGESPPGSGLARAVQEAAWQFLVRPPRLGGRLQTGTWVRIRIDYLPAKPGR